MSSRINTGEEVRSEIEVSGGCLCGPLNFSTSFVCLMSVHAAKGTLILL